MKRLLFVLTIAMSQYAGAVDLYWVNGSGNWDDPNHWASSSNGNGGAGVPSINDDVFFDSHSFNSPGYIQISNNISIGSFDASTLNHKVNFTSNAPLEITLDGSFILSEKSLFRISGLLRFVSSKRNNQINGGDQQLNVNVLFDGKGSWELINNLGLSETSTLDLSKGKLILSGYSLYVGTFNSTGQDKRHLDVQGSTIYITSAWVLDNNISSYTDGGETIILDQAIPSNYIQKGPSSGSSFQLKAILCANLINVTLLITSNYNGQDISCNDSCDAEITVIATSPFGGPFGYNFQASGVFTTQTVYPGLCAGNYTVTVRDSAQQIFPGVYQQCTDNINVNEPPVITFTPLGVIDPSCPDSCDGQAFVSASGGTGALTLNWDNGESGINPQMLCTGWNSLTITDQNGCSHEDSMFIANPPAILANIAVTDASCFGVCDGDATANPSGGNGGAYTFLWSTGGNTNSINALCAGPYDLHIEDINGCPKDTTITVNEPPALVVTLLNQTNLVCFNQCIGELEVAGSNGTAPYTYQWFDDVSGLPTGDVDSLAENLCAGDYYVIVTDANGCSQQSAVFTITQPTQIVPSVSNIVGVLCFGDCNGEAMGSASGGTPGYTFNWIDNGTLITAGSGTAITTLCGGDYFLEVEDANGCIENSGVFTISEPSDITSSLTSTDVLCNSACTGTATITPAGGTVAVNYTIEWHSSLTGLISSGTATSINSLCAGDYFAVVIDDNLCTDTTAVFTINEPTAITITPIVTDLVCNGICNGSVDANPSGGTPPYTYTWFDCATLLPIAGATSQVLSNACAGSYYVEIQDDNGCVVDNSAACSVVSEPPALNISLNSSTNATCVGTCDGTASVTASGGTPVLTISWHDASDDSQIGTGTSISNLCAGTYYAVVTDANGCTDTIPNFVITDNVIVSGTLSITDATCNGFCDGSVTATPSGGVGPYNFEWIELAGGTTLQNGASNSINALCAGNYNLIITDANGCASATIPFTITDSPPLVADVSVTDASCNGICDGTATANPSGGAGALSLTWTPAPGAGQGTATATAMCAGNYDLNITDINGCTLDTTIVISEPAPFDFSIVTTDEQCFGDCDGTVNVTLNSGGVAPITFTYNPAPTSGQGTSSASGFCPGAYTLTIQDANGCDTVVNFTINAAPALNISLGVTTDATCIGTCDGTAAASAAGGTGSLTITWHDASDDSQIGTGSSILTLCAGTYYAVVTDANGCTDTTATFVITDNVIVTGTLTLTDATCNGFCDGAASVVASGGVAPYNYEWIEVAGGTTLLNGPSSSINGLCAGDYELIITDANACASATLTFTINGSPAIVADVTVTNASCNGDCDGAATANPTGGFGGLTLTWTPAPGAGQGTAAASLMCAGNYNLNIVDANGCTLDTVINITEPAPFDFSIATTNEICSGACDGTVNVTLNSGGTAPITYTYNPAPGAGQGTSSASGFCPGAYTLTIQDVNGCDTTVNFTINPAVAINVNAVVTSHVDCNGDCDGVAQVTASGGAGSLTYNWIPAPGSGQGTTTASALCAGGYTVEVTDLNGCVVTDNVTVNEPAQYDIVTSSTDALCNGTCDGTATVTVNSGGTGPYTYSWNDPLNQSTPTATGLCAGVYQVTVSDANNCDTILDVTVNEPAVLAVTVNSTDASCFGVCDGTATAVISGGTAAYSVEWFSVTSGLSVGTGTTISTLCADDYFAQVTDANGCIITSTNFTISEDPQITASIVTANSNCAVCIGTATVIASGGSGTYVNYTWSPAPGAGQGTANGSSMCAGVYSVLVEDSNGCTETFGISINDNAGETVTTDSVDVSCNGACTGQAIANTACLDGPCTYEWFDDLGVSIGQTTQTATNLCVGTYTVEVTNASGCVTTADVNIDQAPELVPNGSFTSPACNGSSTGSATVAPTGGAGGYTYLWSPVPPGGQGSATATGLSSGLWTVTITDLTGCDTSVTFTLTDPPILDVSNTSSTDITCFGANDGIATVFPTGGLGSYSYAWFECITDIPLGLTTQQVTGLAPGSYYVIVTDSVGCSQTTACIDIIEPADISGTLSSTDITCNGLCDGTAQVVPAGGVGNFNYQWLQGATPVAGGTGDIITNLCAGTYSVEITDLNGCTQTISSVTIAEPTAISASAAVTDASCFGTCDGSAIVTASGGTPAYTYTWSPAPGSGQGTANAGAMCAGSYSVAITDVNGCTMNLPVTIGSPSEIMANATVTPITCNGDADGDIQTNASGGTPGYIYSWSPNGEITPGISGLSGNTYTLTIQDANGCSNDTTINLIEPSVITATTNSNSSTCGNSDGNATVSPSGGVGGYTYFWSPAPGGGQGTQTATGLAAGIYTVTVTDAGGCAQDFVIGVSDIGAETVSTSSTDASCFDVADGTATATFVCSDPGCLIEWFDALSGTSTGQTTATATNLSAGDYYVQVTNNSGCITVEPVTINSPSEILANETITNVTCSGNSDGQISVVPSGGSGIGYTYTWAPAPGGGQGTSTATGLTAGVWTVLITDSNGCDSLFSFTVNAPNSISTTLSSTNVTCNGLTDGSATVTASGGNLPYTYQWLDATLTPIGGATSSTLNNIGVGDYNVTVTDNSGCSVTDGPVTITEPTSITGSISGTDVSCNGDCDGTATVSVSGGTGTLIVNWYDSPGNNFIGQSGTTANGLCIGDYYAEVTDDNGCTFTSPLQTITEPTVLSGTVSGTDANCNSICDGTATVVVSGGTPVYTYNWLDSQGQPVSGGGGPSVTALCSDNYTIEVTDFNGCSTGVLPITINQPTAITANVFINSSSCIVNNGSATVVASGGTAPYTYQWFDGAMVALGGETSADILNQAPGTYFVEVTDAQGCSDIFTANISAQNGPVVAIDSTTDVNCFGDLTGAAYISVTSGLGPFTYVWNPGGSVGQDLIGVAAGSYTVEVTDQNGCSTFENVTINENTQLTATFTTVDATCGVCDGEISVSASGGSGSLSYLWSTGATIDSIIGLCAGTYSVTVTDSLGCSANLTTSVNNNGGPTGETIVANNPSCAGGSDGDITVTPTGGTTPYSYFWIHDGGTTNAASNLTAGTYYLEVTDSNGCVRMVEIILSEPAAITDNALITPATCGLCDGEITIAPAGGVNPINVSWLHGPTSQTISGLCEGLYFVELTDANGCIDTFAYGVNGATAPSVVLDPFDATCDNVCDGFIVADTSGGTQPITFNWLDNLGNPIGQSNDTATGLCTGTYILEVTDGSGCLSFAQADVNAPTGLSFSLPKVINASCSGINDGKADILVIGGTLPYTYNWSPAPGVGQGTSSADSLAAGSYTIDVTDINGCTAQQSLTITEPTPIVITLDSLQNALCQNSNDGNVYISVSGGNPGYSYSWTSNPAGFTANTQDIDSVFAQDYIITVTDTNNCVVSDTFTVSALVAISASAGPDIQYCLGNSVTLIGTGSGTSGLTYTWYDTSGNTVSLDSSLTLSEPVGTYVYIFEAANGLCFETDTVIVTVNALPVVDAGLDDEIIEGELVTIGGAPTGPSGATVVWTPNYFIDDITIMNPVVNPDTTTTYQVFVTDTNGCVGNDSVLIYVLPDIVFPNGFSPNGDGVNDTWEIDFMDEFPDCVVEVYNRWGELLFRSVGYTEDWDGNYKNAPLPVGTYYYVINLNHPLYPSTFTGPITILR